MFDKELRTVNRKIVEQFLQCNGPTRDVTRGALFAEDATQEIAFPGPNGFEYRSSPVKEWLPASVVGFPEWSLYDNMIFETDDPSIFLVKSRGMGYQVVNGERTRVEHFYINEFRVKDGKIVLFRETPNPSEEFNPYK